LALSQSGTLDGVSTLSSSSNRGRPVWLSAAEKVARYRHSQLSAVRLAGDINAKNYDDVTLDELLVTIKSELVKLGPHIGLDPNQLLLLQGAENRSPVTVNGSEPEAIPPLRRRSPGTGVSSG
jgi:hypothetical protein